MIGVTGATGAVGGRVAARLAERGAEQLCVVRDPSRAPDLPGAEVRTAAGYAHGDEMRTALDGWIASYLAIARGEIDLVTDTVRSITGREPVTLAEFVRAHPESLDHVED